MLQTILCSKHSSRLCIAWLQYACGVLRFLELTQKWRPVPPSHQHCERGDEVVGGIHDKLHLRRLNLMQIFSCDADLSPGGSKLRNSVR